MSDPGENPEIPELPEAVHEKVVPVTFERKSIFVVSPEQIADSDELMVRSGFGSTLTT